MHLGKTLNRSRGTIRMVIGSAVAMNSPRRGICRWLILDSGVVIGQVWRNSLFLQAFHGGHDRCGILGKSCLISSAQVLYEVCKPPESNMSLVDRAHATRVVRRRQANFFYYPPQGTYHYQPSAPGTR